MVNKSMSFRLAVIGAVSVAAVIYLVAKRGNNKEIAQLRWQINLPGAGVCSPRLADFNGDGTLDIVLGLGPNGGPRVSAISGKDGTVLWSTPTPSHFVGTATLTHVNGDEVPDVIIGSHRYSQRTDADVFAFDGSNGKLLWRLRESNPDLYLPDANFGTVFSLEDCNGDGKRDVMAVQAGGVDDGRLGQPGWKETMRPIGRLHLIDPRTGTIWKTILAPDDAEIYATPSMRKHPIRGWELFFGTGGETLPGHFHSFSFNTFQMNWSVPTKTKGHLSSCIIHDFDGDGDHDAIIATMDGDHLRIDGTTGQVKWRFSEPDCEIPASPGLGEFDGKPGHDIVGAITEGVYPDWNTQAEVVWLNGESGAVIARKTFGTMMNVSPLTVDLDGDGFDEVITASNLSFNELRTGITSELLILDGKEKEVIFRRQFGGYCAGTPALADLDGNGKLDLVHVCAEYLHVFELRHVPHPRVTWDRFRGPNENGTLGPVKEAQGAVP